MHVNIIFLPLSLPIVISHCYLFSCHVETTESCSIWEMTTYCSCKNIIVIKKWHQYFVICYRKSKFFLWQIARQLFLWNGDIIYSKREAIIATSFIEMHVTCFVSQQQQSKSPHTNEANKFGYMCRESIKSIIMVIFAIVQL